MTDNDKLKAKLVDYVQDAHAMELNVEMMLESMIQAAKDAKTKGMLQEHLEQTHDHKRRRIEERLNALDSHPPLRKMGESVAVALPKGLVDFIPMFGGPGERPPVLKSNSTEAGRSAALVMVASPWPGWSRWPAIRG